MCGRYTDTKRDKSFLVRMGVAAANEIQLEFTPRHNIAPTQDAWIVARADDGAMVLKKARWGLVPLWSKDQKIGSSLINARSETIATKPVFRHGFKKRRCLVLADGFFEWKRPEKSRGGKQPYYFRLKNGGQFAMGGVWEQWTSPEGQKLESFCVITVAANELVSSIHDRMPLILDNEGCRSWMNPDASPVELDQLLKPFPAEKMECYPVNPAMNSARIEGEICIQRAETVYELIKKGAPAQGELF